MSVVAEVLGLPETLKALDRSTEQMKAALRGAITKLTMQLLTRVKEQKLSGQVLNVRTGRLRRSITFDVSEQAGQIVGVVGTNVVYSARFEMGFKGDEQVRAHMRTAKMAWGKQIKNPHSTQVKAHVRKVNVPERSFLRSALNEMAPQIQAELAAAVEAACAAAA